MKKLKLLTTTGLIAMAIISCKKDRVCECTTTSGGFSATGSVTLKNVTKKQAKDICVSGVSYDSNGQVTTTTDCKLK